MTIRISTFLLLLVAAAATLFLAVIGNSVLDGDILNFQFYADSVTYEKAARGELNSVTSANDLVGADQNLLGPVLLLKAVGLNRWLVLLFNCTLFACGLMLVAEAYPIRRPLLVGLLVFSPVMFSSLISVNKEIFAYFAICLLMYGLRGWKVWALFLAIAISFLARWQATLFVMTFIGMCTRLNPLVKSRALSVVTLVALLTLIYPSIRILFVADQVAAEAAMANEGTGLYSRMIEIQNVYGYFLVVIPKTIQQLFGLLAKAQDAIPWKDFYNDFMLVVQAAITLILLVTLIAKRRFQLKNQFIYASIVYCVIFALTPIYAPRYFLPVYIFWSLALSLRTDESTELFVAPHANG